jgi:hypothetical protein
MVEKLSGALPGASEGIELDSYSPTVCEHNRRLISPIEFQRARKLTPAMRRFTAKRQRCFLWREKKQRQKGIRSLFSNLICLQIGSMLTIARLFLCVSLTAESLLVFSLIELCENSSFSMLRQFM